METPPQNSYPLSRGEHGYRNFTIASIKCADLSRNAMTEIGPVSSVSERGKAENRSPRHGSARLSTTGVSVVTRIVSSPIILVREFTR